MSVIAVSEHVQAIAYKIAQNPKNIKAPNIVTSVYILLCNLNFRFMPPY